MNVNDPQSDATLGASESTFEGINKTGQEAYSDIVTIDTAVHISAFIDKRYPDGAYVNLSRLHDEDIVAQSDHHSTDYSVLSSHRINEIIEKTGAAYAVIPLWYKTYSSSAAYYLNNLEQLSLQFIIPNASPVICRSKWCANGTSKLAEYFVFPSSIDWRKDYDRLFNALIIFISRQLMHLDGNFLDQKDMCAAMHSIVRTLQALLPEEAVKSAENSPRLPMEDLPSLLDTKPEENMRAAMCQFMCLLCEQRMKEALANPGVHGSKRVFYAMYKSFVQLCEYFNKCIKQFNTSLIQDKAELHAWEDADDNESENFNKCVNEITSTRAKNVSSSLAGNANVATKVGAYLTTDSLFKITQLEKLLVPYVRLPK